MTHARSWYLIIANTAILLWLLQVAAYGGLLAYYAVSTALAAPPMTAAVQRNYAHMTIADRDELHAATSRLRFRFEPTIGIVQDAMASRLVNVDAHGIRANGPHARPMAALDGAIWFLGGSTTFGDGVADHETIPAQLERITGRPVINLGVPAYSSPLENLLFAHYLRQGYQPARALFLDGLNETCEPDLYGEEMRELFRRAQQAYYWDVGGPVGAALTRGWRKARHLAGLDDPRPIQTIACSRDGTPYPLAELHSRILTERAALCRAYAVDCHTLVQPFAGTHGPADALPEDFLAGEAKTLREVYHHLEPVWMAAGATFLTDALDGYAGHPFVDEMHYSADASRVIAGLIARRLSLR